MSKMGQELDRRLDEAKYDLYYACKMLIRGIERDCDGRGKDEFTVHRDSPFVDTFRKAIAKVEGAK